jgi:hypothetical protein
MSFLAYAGLALASKWLEPKISIFVSLLCAFFLDILSLSFALSYVIIGNVDFNFAYRMSLPWTHSFATAIVWSIVAMLMTGGILIFRHLKNKPTIKIPKASILGYSSVVALIVFSNWLIDFIAIPSNWGEGLPLSIDGYKTVGLGLANTIPRSIALQIGVLTIGIVLYLLKNKSKIIKSKAWQTHNPGLFKSFIIVFSLSFILLGIGLFFVIDAGLTNNNVYLYYSNLYEDKATNFLIQPSSITTQIPKDVPYMDKNLLVIVNITISSDSYFVKNTPIQINATASYNQSADCDIVINNIYVRPIGSTTVYPNEYSATGYSSNNYPCSLILWRMEQENISKFNTASEYCIFENSGPISFNIDISLSTKYGEWEKIKNWYDERGAVFENEYSIIVTPDVDKLKILSSSELTEKEQSNLHSIAEQRREALKVRLQTIETAILTQQQANNERSDKTNIGLTFVIMFLAVVEISFIIYEQSKDEELCAKYYQKKARKRINKEKKGLKAIA